MHLPPILSLGASSMIGLLVRDLVLTQDEVTELTSSLLVSRDPPLGTIRLVDWAAANADQLGRRYHSKLARHFR